MNSFDPTLEQAQALASASDRETTQKHRPIILWLAGLISLLLLLITVGGTTRLTGSGLSITEWKPIMGAIPPLSHEAWEEAFAKYKLIPQYKILNPDMTLDGFKFIFFWEWFHRLLGRLVGVAFFIPWVIFLVQRRIDGKLGRRLFVGFLLGGAQGFLGWFMVQSGLAERTSVSHYRLAAHLGLALVILSYLYWVMLDLLAKQSPARVRTPVPHAVRAGIKLVMGLLCLQIFYGALVAGLKAGFGYNTFPKMMGFWIHPDAWRLESLAANVFDNPAMVQFIHRSLGWTLFAAATGLYFFARSRIGDRRTRRPITFFAHSIWGQFLLGVATLVMAVPVSLGAAHQLFGCIVLLAGLKALHSTRAPARLH